jgi:hypothetical protein
LTLVLQGVAVMLAAEAAAGATSAPMSAVAVRNFFVIVTPCKLQDCSAVPTVVMGIHWRFRFFVAWPPVQDLLFSAKHLFVAASPLFL